ncbi:23945_t:CDS:2 [Cetraspora pellucida]|uniref:23945_t:CDS:1 n=1 Tax=Cetraspora pellucida TaxID=1433469 RepID=A0A9N9G7G3_9GLOM|nr:23945_t:CDS:2 [Cetraspora pellucida]
MSFSKRNSILALCLLNLLLCFALVKGDTYMQGSVSTTAGPDVGATVAPGPTGSTPLGTAPTEAPTGTPTAWVATAWATSAPYIGATATPYPSNPSALNSSAPSSPTTPSAPTSTTSSAFRNVVAANLISVGLFVCSMAFYLN